MGAVAATLAGYCPAACCTPMTDRVLAVRAMAERAMAERATAGLATRGHAPVAGAETWSFLHQAMQAHFLGVALEVEQP